MKSRVQKKFVLGVLMGAVLGSMTLVAGIVIFFLYFYFGGPAEVTEDDSRYEEMLEKHSNVRSGFVVFPKHLLCGEEDAEFYFFYQNIWDDPTVQVFLKCQYDAETYEAEVARLESLTKLKYDDSERFIFPAYMAIDGAGRSYEYALAGDDCQMVYVFTSYVYQDKIAFDKQYLPKDYEEIFERDYREYMNEEHTIYLKETAYGLSGEPDGWVFDYDIDGK